MALALAVAVASRPEGRAGRPARAQLRPGRARWTSAKVGKYVFSGPAVTPHWLEFSDRFWYSLRNTGRREVVRSSTPPRKRRRRSGTTRRWRRRLTRDPAHAVQHAQHLPASTRSGSSRTTQQDSGSAFRCRAILASRMRRARSSPGRDPAGTEPPLQGGGGRGGVGPRRRPGGQKASNNSNSSRAAAADGGGARVPQRRRVYGGLEYRRGDGAEHPGAEREVQGRSAQSDVGRGSRPTSRRSSSRAATTSS